MYNHYNDIVVNLLLFCIRPFEWIPAWWRSIRELISWIKPRLDPCILCSCFTATGCGKITFGAIPFIVLGSSCILDDILTLLLQLFKKLSLLPQSTSFVPPTVLSPIRESTKNDRDIFNNVSTLHKWSLKV